MNLSILLAKQILVMALMVFFGYLAGKSKLITLSDSSSISKLVLYLLCPCVALSALQTEFSWQKAMGFGLAIASVIVVHVIFFLIDLPMNKLFHFNGVERASIIYSNCGNLIIPIISYMLGPDYVIYSCAYVVVQTVLIWTHCISTITEVKQINLKKVIKNPNIIAITLGTVLFFMKLQLPDVLSSAVTRTGDCIGPVSMIVVGIMLGSADLVKVFTNKRSWIVSLIRLILCPLAVVLVMWITHATSLTAEASQVLFIVFLASAAPSASTVSQMANVYHKDEIQAGTINMMSIMLCIVTMPIMTMVYQFLCMK